MASSQGNMTPQGPPYPPQAAAIGGAPTVSLDVPVSAVFIFLFILGAIGHMTVLQVNRRKGHKFIMSGLMFGLCMARITANIMRIAWACRPHNIRIAIAAGVLVSAGVLLLFIVNLLFAQRVVRAAHPHIGWHKTFHFVFMGLYIMIGGMLVMIITATVIGFYTLNPKTHKAVRDIQLLASTYLVCIAFLPIPMVLLALVLPRKTRLDKFGSGRWRTKVRILLAGTALLTLGAGFRTGVAWMPPRPVTHPGWFDAKWCFYVFNFSVEILVIYLYLIMRVDRRFHIPNGSHHPGDYSQTKDEIQEEKQAEDNQGGFRINSEEEMFDDEEEPAQEPTNQSKDEKDVENQRLSAFFVN